MQQLFFPRGSFEPIFSSNTNEKLVLKSNVQRITFQQITYLVWHLEDYNIQM